MSQSQFVEAVYHRRFDDTAAQRNRVWHSLCTHYFQRYVQPTDTVLEVAAGYCEFINNIHAAKKIAVDLNPDAQRHAAGNVSFITSTSTDLSSINDNSIDFAFTSNFFEHITREEIGQTLREVCRVLKPGGRYMILQPNIRYCGANYWMFFDHITALDDRSLGEALEINGYKIVTTVRRFLPYTMKGKMPKAPWLVQAYLRLPMLWNIFGQQSLLVGEKPA